MSAMQYAQALEHLIREVSIADPALGHMHVLKADGSDGFYCIGLRPTTDPKLGLVFPSEVEDEELVVIPLTLPMGWKNSTPIFCTATETVADLVSEALHCNTPALPHRLDDIAKVIIKQELPTLQL